MPRICTICSNAEREAIDAALLTTETKRGIAQRFAVAEDAIGRHAAKHLAHELRETADLAEVGRIEVLVAEVLRLRDHADRLGKIAEEQGDLRVALAAIRESRETMAFMSKLLGLGAHDVLDVQVNGEIHHFEPSPEFLARVATNLSDLKLPEQPMVLIDMPVTPVAPTAEEDDAGEDAGVDEYDAASGEVHPHRNGATPPPSGLGLVRLPGSNPDRWNWDR
jgi:hypothetical protein